MLHNFTFSEFINRFSTDDICLEENKKLRYPNGVKCVVCKKVTRHYKVSNRTAYLGKVCRHQIYPLKDTIFEKTTTPLRLWFYAMFLMTYTRAEISIKALQKELKVTYKTAWRMYKQIKMLMQQNKGDLLVNPVEVNRILRWTFLNKLEFTVTEKKETAD